MTRKTFIKNAGLGLISGPFVLKGASYFQTRSLLKASPPPFDCVLAPSQTGGPFYLDPKYKRKDITEGVPGLPLFLKIKVLGVTNCEPVPNALVNIWHCDSHGVYSEFGSVYGNADNASEDTWLRGYQYTDANGYCEFKTIFPGWYPGRATHIHFDVHLGFDEKAKVDGKPNTSSTFFSQMYIPNRIKSKVYREIEAYATKGDNPTGTNNDFIYKNTGASEALMMSFDEQDYPNTLSAEFRIGLDMAGTPSKAQNLEGRKYFQLKQNRYKPSSSKTSVDFKMHLAGMVTLSIFNEKDELVAQLMNRRLLGGNYLLEIDHSSKDYNLSPGTYTFDMLVHNQYGRFRQSRKLLII